MAIAPQHFAIIKKPLVTEKTANEMVNNIYAFEVAAKANKFQIAAAVEAIWNVKVDAVRTMNKKGEQRRNLHGKFQTRNRRKAYVKLKDGYAIEVV